MIGSGLSIACKTSCCFEETGEVSPSKQPIRYDSRVLDKYQEILVVSLIKAFPDVMDCSQ